MATQDVLYINSALKRRNYKKKLELKNSGLIKENTFFGDV